MEALQIALKAKAALLSKKGEDVVILDIRGLSSIADYFLVATGTSAPHLKALAGAAERELREENIRLNHKDGTPESGWMVLDYVDTVVHVFSSEARKYYALERLWSDAPQVAS